MAIAELLQFDREAIADSGLSTAVRTLFVTRAAACSSAERQALQALATEPTMIGRFSAEVTSDQRSEGFGDPKMGDVPWAPTAASTRWSVVALAALFRGPLWPPDFVRWRAIPHRPVPAKGV